MRQSNVVPECEYQNIPAATPGPCDTGLNCASFTTNGSESSPTVPDGSTAGPDVRPEYAAGRVVSPRSQWSKSAMSTSGNSVDTGRAMRVTSDRPVDPFAAAAGSGTAVSSTTTCGVAASFTLLVFMRCAIEYPTTSRYPVANNSRNGNAPHSPTYNAYKNAAAV